MSDKKQAYEMQNKQDYDDYTDKIHVALDEIEKNRNLKTTLTQVYELTGIHRNTLRERNFPKRRLLEIKNKRKVEDELDKKPKKNQLQELESQLDNAKTELIYWFSKHETIEAELSQMEMKFLREKDALEFYKNSLQTERDKSKKMQTEIDRLTDLLRDL
jgi:chromosome segregation ATPase|tara:strand:- start:26574 stop:27053 length:480 start_codon:yes stop_codon:yes gene_type:complete